MIQPHMYWLHSLVRQGWIESDWLDMHGHKQPDNHLKLEHSCVQYVLPSWLRCIRKANTQPLVRMFVLSTCRNLLCITMLHNVSKCDSKSMDERDLISKCVFFASVLNIHKNNNLNEWHQKNKFYSAFRPTFGWFSKHVLYYGTRARAWSECVCTRTRVCAHIQP